MNKEFYKETLIIKNVKLDNNAIYAALRKLAKYEDDWIVGYPKFIMNEDEKTLNIIVQLTYRYQRGRYLR